MIAAHPYIGNVEHGAEFVHLPAYLSEYAKILSLPAFDMQRDPLMQAYRQFETYTYGAWMCPLADTIRNRGPVIPANVTAEAEKYSRELVFTFNTFRSKILRDRSHGSLDSSKLSRLASPGLSAREFERLSASAFRHREHVQSQTMRPRIAIVADTNNDIRTKDPLYMGKVGRLAYTLAEAAKLSGVEVALIGSRGRLYGPQQQNLRAKLGLQSDTRKIHIATVLKGWDTDMTGSEFYIMTGHNSFVTVLRAITAFINNDDDGMESANGSGGIEFARLQGANIVIGIGKFGKNEKPDLQFDPRMPIADIVARIVAHMQAAA